MSTKQAEIISSVNWEELGQSHPYTGWGGEFRIPALRLIGTNNIIGFSFISIDEKAVAHTHWGRIFENGELINFIDEASRGLLPAEAEWSSDFEQSLESLRAKSERNKLGVLAIAHTKNGHGPEFQTAVYGIAPEVAASALKAFKPPQQQG